MTNLVKLVGFFTLVLLWPKALANITTEVKELMDQFLSLKADTNDILTKLRNVRDNAHHFMWVTHPVGALIAAGAGTHFKPKAEEQEAFKVWHNFVKVEFENLRDEIQELKSGIKYYLIQDEYIKAVTRPLDVFEKLYRNITNPDKKRSEYLEEFSTQCIGNLNYISPIEVLNEMKRVLATGCALQSQEQTEGYAEVLEIFQKIEQRHFQNNKTIPTEEYEYIKSSLLAKPMGQHLQNELNKILQTASSTDVGQALTKLHSDLHGVQNGCWLETLADGNEWKREPLLRFADIMRLDLIKAFLLSAHCVEIMYDDDKSQIDLLKWIKEIIKEIALNMVEWIEKKLKITWPTISISHAETAIGNWPIVENESEYNIVAQRIKKDLDQIGEKIFFHTVIVFPNWTDERQKAVICDDYYCFKLIKNHINVIVIRCEHDHYEEAVAAENWFNQTVEEQMERMIKEWLKTKKDEPLTTLAKQMHPHLYYRSMVLLRNRAIPQIGTTITLGVTPTEISSARAERSFNKMIITGDNIEEIFHVHLLV